MMDLVEVEKPDDVTGRAPQGNTIAGGPRTIVQAI
jgi:hypothetical protein